MEPMHILMLIAAIVLIAVIALIRKVVAIVITIVILGIVLIFANKHLSTSQKTAVESFLSKGRDTITSLVKKVASDDVKTDKNGAKVQIEDKWYDLATIKDKIEYRKDGIYFKQGDKTTKIVSPGVVEFFNGIKKSVDWR